MKKIRLLVLLATGCLFVHSLSGQVPLSNFFEGDPVYKHREVNATSTAPADFINTDRNLLIINRVFNASYSSLDISGTGHINGEYTQTVFYGGCNHKGIDYRAPENTPIYALMDGVITAAATNAYGTIAIYNSEADVTLLYLHCSGVADTVQIDVGKPVTRGQLIGYSGSVSPDAIGPHLHLELRSGNTSGSAATPCSALSGSKTYDPRIVFDLLPERVRILSPVTNGQVDSSGINFSWEPVSGATMYYAEISTSSLFTPSSVVHQRNTVGNSFVWTGRANKEYFFRVHSDKTTGFDNLDEKRRFLTRPAPPVLTYPAAGASGVSRPILFKWNAVEGANAYRIQIATSSSLLLQQYNGPFLVDTAWNTASGNPANQFLWSGAQPGQTYYWRVRVNTNKGTSLFRGRGFTTGSNLVSVLVSNGFEVVLSANQLHYAFDDQPWQTIQLDNDGDAFLPVEDLNPGYHDALFYIKDVNGKNSGITRQHVVKVSGEAETSLLEYWFDHDFSNRQSMVVTDLRAVDLNLSAASLSNGYHTLHYRFQLNGGMWSSVSASLFLKNTSAASGPQQMEYWFDDAFTNRRSVTITNPSAIDEAVSTSGLSIGTHILYYRFKTGTDLWSSVSASTFIKNTNGNGVTKMEYWFNDNFQTRQSKSITNLQNIDFNLATTGLPLGENMLYTRFLQGGSWSGVTAMSFNKTTTGGGSWQYQYWVDSTIGTARTITISNPSAVDEFININDADTGWHLLFSRFRISGGQWSSVTADSFYKTTPAANCTILNPPTLDSLQATQYLCQQQIIISPQDGEINKEKLKRKDLAKITYRGLLGSTEPPTPADYLPSLFGDLQNETPSNSYYFKAAKLLSYLDYGDGITPFNPSRLNFHPEDTIVRGYVLKVLLEAWNIKPDITLPNPYSDLVSGAEVNGYIQKAAQMGIIRRPDIDGPNFVNFRPYEACTRIEAFLMLYRLLQVTGKPDIRDEDFYIPHRVNEIVGTKPGLGEGNFSNYSETPIVIKGVPSLQFSFQYNAASAEWPEEAVKGRDGQQQLVYDQLPLGRGWTHSYNAYIIHDIGNDDIDAADDRYLIFWPEGNVQTYHAQQNKYITKGVYDELTEFFTAGPASPYAISIKTKSQLVYRFEKIPGAASGTLLQLVSVTDRHGNGVSLQYENGYSENPGINIKRLKTVSDPHGRLLQFSYHPSSNLLDSVTALAGSLTRSVQFDYVGQRLTQYVNAKNDNTIYNYSALPGQSFLLTKIVLPKGNVISNTYNRSNKLTSSEVNNEQQLQVETNPVYTATSNYTDIKIRRTVNGVELEQQMRQDQSGLPVFAKGPGYKRSIQYTDTVNPLLPTRVIDSLTGIELQMQYDNKGNLVLQTQSGPGLSITTQAHYNTRNDVDWMIDGNGNRTDYIYNSTGQLIQVQAPAGVTTSVFPNSNGTVDSIVNPSGIGTRFLYDSYGNPAGKNLPLQISTSAVNDAFGRTVLIQDANGVPLSFRYDNNDNKETERYDSAGLDITTLYRFDKNDNLLETENANGHITSRVYNSQDQLIREQFGSDVKTYTYDGDGRVKSFTSPNGFTFTNQYDTNDLLINDGYAAYSYYPDNSLHTVSRNGRVLTYTYDGLKRIKTVTCNDFSGNTVSYDYDDNNHITGITYPGGFRVNYEYNSNNRLVKVKDATGTPWATYTYHADGRLQSQLNRNNTETKYFYDAAGRMDSLVTVKSDGTPIAAYGFELDKNGNHKKETVLQPFGVMPPSLSDSFHYTYNAVNRLLTRNDEQYAYDQNGNLLSVTKSGSAALYEYDEANHLLQYSKEGNVLSFEYDGLGQRRKRNQTRFVLDQSYNVLMETDAAGTPLYYYIHGLGLVARVKASNSNVSYYHYDYRGSTVAMTNSAQTITHQYQYGAFGETLQVQEADFNAFRYVGQYGVQYETRDLTFMRARYYHPGTGRFISEDPVWSTNLYPYAENNPVYFTDPMGESVVGKIIAGAAIGAVVGAGLVVGAAFIYSTFIAAGTVAVGAVLIGGSTTAVVATYIGGVGAAVGALSAALDAGGKEIEKKIKTK